MNKVLFVPCYPGELGWELINYIPYVNHLSHASKYEEIHAMTRIGRECLYPMATQVYPVALSSHKSMGNSGIAPPKNHVLKNLTKNFKVDVVPSLKGMKYFKPRQFLKYSPDPNISAKWDLPAKSVVCSVRGRNFGIHKNWAGDNWQK